MEGVIADISSDGKTITLKDGKKFSVCEHDLPLSIVWHASHTLLDHRVQLGSSDLQKFPVSIYNRDVNQSVRVAAVAEQP